MSLSPWMYVTLLGLVCIVYAQLLPKGTKPAATTGGDMMKELEQSMEMFATDMEEQNEALLQLFSETKRDYEGHLSKLSGRLEQLEEMNSQLIQELTKARPEPAVPVISVMPGVAEAVPAQAAADSREASPPEPAAAEEPSRSPLLLNMKERYAELFRLHEQNKSVEYIAKKLNMNKGEVQLILQLSKQEEKTHA